MLITATLAMVSHSVFGFIFLSNLRDYQSVSGLIVIPKSKAWQTRPVREHAPPSLICSTNIHTLGLITPVVTQATATSPVLHLLNEYQFLEKIIGPCVVNTNSNDFSSLTMESHCSSPNCSEPATLSCSGCNGTRYCSKTCQTTPWTLHKKTCSSTQKNNCYLIRASTDSASAFCHIHDHVEAFSLREFGNEFSEIKELKDRLGWKSGGEIGKFYDHLGTDQWYYYVYGQASAKAEGKPANELASKACSRKIWGDVAVIRSGPVGNAAPEMFTSGSLCKTLKWLEDRDCSVIFSEREQSRAMRSMGFSSDEIGKIPHASISI